jgi:hypothetical protein
LLFPAALTVVRSFALIESTANRPPPSDPSRLSGGFFLFSFFSRIYPGFAEAAKLTACRKSATLSPLVDCYYCLNPFERGPRIAFVSTVKETNLFNVIGGIMKARNYIASHKVGDAPALCKSACITCQNKGTCKTIATTFAAIGAEHVLRHSSPVNKKKYAAIADHLRREGFSYPNVKRASSCWMYSKFGVAIFYENQLAMLADKILKSSVVPPPVIIRESILGKL